VSLFERKEVDRIILSRPAVEAGERLGFLPGDLREKVDPYLRPIYDALHDLMDARIVERAMQTNEIEIAPLAFMRGRTLSNAVVILDEAQNTTAMQMKMFLTRLGENSRMIVTGDPSQVDLPPGQVSGLAEAMRLLEGVEGIGHAAFTAADVVRTNWWRGLLRPTTRPTPRAGVGRRIEQSPSPTLPALAAAKPKRLRFGERGAGEEKQVDLPHKPRREKQVEIDVTIRSARWRKRPTPKPSSKGHFGAAKAVSTQPIELAIVLGDDSAIRALNRDWRGKNAPTNVLSFPAAAPGKTRSASPYVGDIVIAYQTTAREAVAEGKPFNHHLTHLAIHGFLHLLGYDHENDRDAEKMERLERRILKRLAVPDPYAPT